MLLLFSDDTELGSLSTTLSDGVPLAIKAPWPYIVPDKYRDEVEWLYDKLWPDVLTHEHGMWQERNWPVADFTDDSAIGMGVAYNPLVRSEPDRVRYVDPFFGSNSNDGLTPGTAWKGLKAMMTNTTHCPPTGGTRIYVLDDVDLAQSDQYSTGTPNKFIETLAPGATDNPHEVEPLPGRRVAIRRGSLEFRAAHHWRVSGFDIDTQGLTGLAQPVVTISNATQHFELAYCSVNTSADHGLVIESGTADIHSISNRYTQLGNAVHSSGSPFGIYDGSIYVKESPRFVSINDMFHENYGGYDYRFQDTVNNNPGNGSRIFHATSVGREGTNGILVDGGDDIQFYMCLIMDHAIDPNLIDPEQQGQVGRWQGTYTDETIWGSVLFNNARSLAGDIDTDSVQTVNPGVLWHPFGFSYEVPAASPLRNHGTGGTGIFLDHFGRPRGVWPEPQTVGAIE